MRLRLSKEHDPLCDGNKVIKQCLIHVNFYTRCFENKQVGCGAELLSQLLRHYQSLGSTDVPSLAEGLPVMRQGVADQKCRHGDTNSTQTALLLELGNRNGKSRKLRLNWIQSFTGYI